MFFGSASRSVQKSWQPLTGQVTFDFDNLPGGDGGGPAFPPSFPVSSVAGETGDVVASDLAGALTPFLLSAAALGAPSGAAPLGADSKVPDANLPAASNAAAVGLKLDKAATGMPNAQDLNNYTTTGFWNVQSNSAASGGTNYPLPLAGMLTVVARSANDSVTHSYKVYSSGDRYERMLYGGNWSAWKKVALNLDSLFLNPKDYGVVGDGVANDSTGLQNWLNAGGVRLPPGTYLVNTGLTLTGDNRNLYADNATLIAGTTEMVVLTITGNRHRVSVAIDGKNKASYGIKSSGAGGTIEKCRVENIYSATNTARGIEVTTAGGAIIRNNTINNVVSVGNATRGDGPGFARAILLYTLTAATARSMIEENIIDNISGEEGDAIAVLAFDGVANPFLSAKATVRNNEISNVSRRFIKIQGSDVRVLGNVCTHDGVVPANPSTAIDLIQSDNVTVMGNTVPPNPLLNSIASNGTAAVLNKNIIIQDNTITQSDSKVAPAIYINYAKDSSVKNNVVTGGTYAVLLGNTIGVSVQGNEHFGGDPTIRSFDSNSTNTGTVMRNNTNMNPARTSYISNVGPGAVTELNSTRT